MNTCPSSDRALSTRSLFPPETWDPLPLSPVCNPYCKPSAGNMSSSELDIGTFCLNQYKPLCPLSTPSELDVQIQIYSSVVRKHRQVDSITRSICRNLKKNSPITLEVQIKHVHCKQLVFLVVLFMLFWLTAGGLQDFQWQRTPALNIHTVSLFLARSWKLLSHICFKEGNLSTAGPKKRYCWLNVFWVYPYIFFTDLWLFSIYNIFSMFQSDHVTRPVFLFCVYVFTCRY